MTNNTKIEKVMIGVPEIMKMMGIGRNRAYDIVGDGHFPVKRVGRRYLVHKDVFEEWLKKDEYEY